MPEAPYRIEDVLHESPDTLVRRGRRREDDRRVILKSLKPEAPHSRFWRLQQEFLLNHSLEAPSVCPALDLVTLDGMPTLVTADIRAVTLRAWAREAHDLADRLRVAVGAAQALSGLHALGVIHCDVSPDHLLVRPEDLEIRLIDLGLATFDHQSAQAPLHPKDLQGTLAGLAPEQTGRLPRAIDRRADLYALGATLFELFAGSGPFASDDPLELVHAHLARSPPPLSERFPAAPPALSELIATLLEKRPEDRYQSASAVASDLELILSNPDTRLPLPGAAAGPTLFSLPKRLYGRESQQRRLFQFLERTGNGTSAFVLLSGDVGSGKSTLVSAAVSRADSYRARTVIARFTRASNSERTPPVALAFAPLIGQILTAPEAERRRWRTRLRRALGDHADTLGESIPGLAALLGTTRTHSGARPRTTRRRFEQAFRKFVEACADPGSPLLIVLEGCEWLDADSLRLLQRLPGNGGVAHLLIVGTTADSRRAISRLGPLAPDPEGSHHIAIGALPAEGTRLLVADVLQRSETTVADIAARIHARSAGNPMATLDTLHAARLDGLVSYDRSRRHWRWSTASIAASPLLTAHADPLRARLDHLPEGARERLEVAACFGERFAPILLAHVLEEPLRETLGHLRVPLEEGHLVPIMAQSPPLGPAPLATRIGPLDDHADDATGLRFAHERVHREIYQQLTVERRGALHDRVGAMLLKIAAAEATSPQVSERLFLDGVSQLGFASALPGRIPLPGLDLAELHLRAGRLARDNDRPQSAFRYFRTGMGLLGRLAWAEHPALMAELTEAAIDAAFRCADPAQVERLSRAALAHDVLEQPRHRAVRLRLTAMLTRAYFAQGRVEAGMAVALPALRRHGVELRKPTTFLLPMQRFIWAARRHLASPMTASPAIPGDDRIYLAQLLLDVSQAAWSREPALTLTGLRQLLTMGRKAGMLPQTAFALAGAATAAVDRRHWRLARRMRGRAEDLLATAPEDRASIRARMVLGRYVQPWLDSGHTGQRTLVDAFESSLATGDLDGAGFAAAAYASNSILLAEPLAPLARQIRDLAHALGAHTTPPGLSQVRAYLAFIEWLVFSEAGQKPNLPDDSGTAQGAHPRLLHAWRLVLDGNGVAALETLEALAGGSFVTLPSPAACQVHWLLALASLDAALESGGTERRRLLRQARRARGRLRLRGDRGVLSARARIGLIDAELAAASGRAGHALERFGRAAGDARALGSDHDEALAWQRAAAFCDRSGTPLLVPQMHAAAQTAWQRWGAHAQAARLRPEPSRAGPRSAEAHADRSSARSGMGPQPDPDALLDAVRSIASEIRLEQLQPTVLRLALERSGADHGSLVLAEDTQLMVAARASATDGCQTLDPPRSLLESGDLVPAEVLQFVARNRETLVLDDATVDAAFSGDPYVLEFGPRALACVPLTLGDRLIGLLYLEHRRHIAAFTSERLEPVRLLAAQAAIGVDNARLYQALALARDDYRELFEHAVEGIFRIGLDGRLQQANPALADALGYANTDELLQAVRFLPRDLAAEPTAAVQLLDRTQATGQVIASELEAFRRDGSRTWIAISARLIRDEDSEARAIEGSLVDINERRQRLRAERERELAQAATEAKSRFLANMSHEIRTPMNAILGFSELMLATPLESRQRDFATTIHAAAESLLRLINDILDFSRIEAGQLSIIDEAVDLPGLLAEVETLFSSSARQKGLALHCLGGDTLRQALDELGTPRGDSGRLRQVLVNLLGNAIKFTDRGRVELEAKVVATATDSVRVAFTVCDTGIGIATEDQGRLFHAFEQLETSRSPLAEGTGLGLAISKQLVELMGGTLSVESTPGAGSTFEFALEFDLGKTKHAATDGPRREARDRVRGCTVLVAEDDRINQQLAVEFLRQAGADVHVTESGAGVLRMLRERHFDAVLMDLHMPGMDGLETCRALRQSKAGRDLVVIAVTADATADSIDRARRAGFDDYVIKPLTLAHLVAALEEHLPSPAEPGAADAPGLPADLPPRLPGLDLGRALRNHNDNPALLGRLAGQFVELYGNAPETLAAELQRGRREQAIRLAHNLHGVAGSFGAERLRLAARRVEHALEAGADLSAAPMQEFGTALAEAVADMRRVVQALMAPKS